MREDFEASVVSVGEVFARRRRLIVPTFQRPFAWTEHEAATLLADLRTAHLDAADRGDHAPRYFLGSIVLARALGDDFELIVDGQQRLTTLTMLLAILRDLDEDVAETLGGFVLEPGPLGAPRPRLSPRPLDAAFFLSAVQTPGATLALDEDAAVENDAQANMLSAALKMRGELQKLSGPSRRWLGDFVLRRAVLVEVAAPAEDQAYHIFRVMNARGRNLTDSDLLKSELLGHVPALRQGRFTALWERLEAELGAPDFAALFSHLRSIHRPGKARKSVLAELREILDPTRDPEKFLEEELAPKGRIYRDLLDATMKLGARSEEVNRILRALNRVNNADWAPPAIAFFAGKRRRGDEAIAFLEALERVAYGLFLQAADENVRLARYKKPIETIREGGDIAAILEQLQLTGHDRRIARMVLDGAIYQKERIRLPVLLRLDERLSDGSASYEFDHVSVEHVLPRNPPPDSPWLALFADAQRRKYWTDRLGNLALLSRRKNNDAANLAFEEKKRAYFSNAGVSPFALTSQILMEPTWSPEVVERRHKALLKTACEMWGL